ncbi:MAG: class I SAM-dependent methyltransferase [Planctomycetes bacterium]|nr:class I SAM-dependent methyltransferase [Planctomycetota bacterium]
MADRHQIGSAVITSAASVPARKVDRRIIDYSSHAPVYDERRFEGRVNRYLEMLRFDSFRVLARAHPPGSRVLDVGCGTGRGLLYLMRCGFRTVTGIDCTPAMLEQAREKLARQCPDGRVKLIEGDAFALPWSDASFDLVTSFNFLHMFRLDRQIALLEEMARVCRPKGCLIFELDSIHKGLFFSRYLEQRRVADRTKFNSIWELKRMLPRSKFIRYRVVGTGFPVVYRIFSRMPRIGLRIEAITHLAPLGWLSERVFVSAVRR